MQSFFANFLLVLAATATVDAHPSRKAQHLGVRNNIPIPAVEVKETITETNTILTTVNGVPTTTVETITAAILAVGISAPGVGTTTQTVTVPYNKQTGYSLAFATTLSSAVTLSAIDAQIQSVVAAFTSPIQASAAQPTNAWTTYSALHWAAPTSAAAASSSIVSTPPSIQYSVLHSAVPAATTTIPSAPTIQISSLSQTSTQASSTTIVPAATSSSPVAPAVTSSTSTTASSTIPFLRGVNLGGWLVLEKWMNSDAFTGSFANAADQYTFDSISGAADALKTHWDTFFTQSDIQTMAATGINALRIPIGFWAYDNANTPYIQGADAYLEKAISWARAANMKVWVDLHGSPGSQNGFDNSGHAGDVNWQQTANLQRSISVLQTMATKYGSLAYADVVVGLELVNEPISWGNNNFDITKSWAQDAYKAVKAAATNKNLVIVMHDAFEGANAWSGVASSLSSDRTFGVDSHLYQLFTDSDNALTQAQHISKACGWASDLSSANKQFPTYVGEWSAATNICTNPDGSTTAGTSCSTDGCQCQSGDFFRLNTNSIAQIRRYVEAQLDVFESSTSGYFIWAAKGPGGWGFLNLIQQGAFPNPVTSRQYAGQCGGVSRRAVKNRLD